ncbi:MAG: hypothetical protein AB7O96_01890 [Pseudobdellovibrionaceae bacterium]
MPNFIAHRLIRSALNLAVPQKDSTLRFEIATSLTDLKKALTLVQENFLREGYAEVTASGTRLTPYHLLPDTIVIVAKRNSKIVATATLIPYTQFGVPIESNINVDTFVRQSKKTCEISALAVDTKHAGAHGEVLFNLMKYMYHCNLDLLNVDLELIGVNPKMVPLYEAILLFSKIPGVQNSKYRFANGAEVVPMYFKFAEGHQQFAPIYQGKPPHLNLLEFFLAPIPPQYDLPKMDDLISRLPQRNPRSLLEILKWEPTLLNKLPKEKLQILVNLHSANPECQKILHNLGKTKWKNPPTLSSSL